MIGINRYDKLIYPDRSTFLDGLFLVYNLEKENGEMSIANPAPVSSYILNTNLNIDDVLSLVRRLKRKGESNLLDMLVEYETLIVNRSHNPMFISPTYNENIKYDKSGVILLLLGLKMLDVTNTYGFKLDDLDAVESPESIAVDLVMLFVDRLDTFYDLFNVGVFGGVITGPHVSYSSDMVKYAEMDSSKLYADRNIELWHGYFAQFINTTSIEPVVVYDPYINEVWVWRKK